MKKFFPIIATVLCTLLIFSLTACNGKGEVPPIDKDDERPTYNGTKTLVVYFSQPDNVDNSTVVINGETLGNTQYMAYVIQENTGQTSSVFYPKHHIPQITVNLLIWHRMNKEKMPARK